MKKILIIICLMISLFGCDSVKKTTDQPESLQKVRIGIFKHEVNLLFHLSKQLGLFKKYGVDVELKEYLIGRDAFKGMLEGEVDLAFCTDFVVVKNSFKDRNYKIIAAIAEANSNGVLIKKSSGVQHPSGLKGKNFGTTFGSLTEYFSGVFLSQHGLEVQDVNFINVPVKDRLSFMDNKNLDALFAWDPYIFMLKKQYTDKLLHFPMPASFPIFFILVESDQFHQKSPQLSKAILKALIDAEQWVQENPDDIVGKVSKLYDHTETYTRHTLTKHQFRITFPYSISSVMDSQASWLLNSGIIKDNKSIDFTDVFNIQPLKLIKPHVVTIIE